MNIRVYYPYRDLFECLYIYILTGALAKRLGVGSGEFQPAHNLPTIRVDGPFGTASEVCGIFLYLYTTSRLGTIARGMGLGGGGERGGYRTSGRLELLDMRSEGVAWCQ